MSEEEKGIKEEERKEKFGEFLKEIEEVNSTKEERKSVADSYRNFLKTLSKSKKDTSLVFLITDKRTAVKRTDIPKLLEEDPEFYKRYKKLIQKEK